MTISIFSIGMSGMGAAQAGMVTTGHNISNASTRGYSRQEAIQVTNVAQSSGAGFLGQGVSIDTVRRVYSDVLSNQLSVAQTQGSQIDTFNQQIKQLANMLGDASAGLAPALTAFFAGVATVASNAQSVPARQAMLSSAKSLAAGFQDLDQQMNQMRSSINASITNSVDTINSYAQQIASLNHSIQISESAAGGQPANDLRDQRDAIVADLNQEVQAQVVKQSNGTYAVFVGNGQPIVVDDQVFKLSAMPSPEDMQRTVVGYPTGGANVTLADASLQGGMLGGLLSFRSGSLDAAQNSLGRVAMGLAQSFNAQHALGQDLNGALGGNFFSVSSPIVLPDSHNAGTGAVTATLQDASALTTSDYKIQYQGNSAGNENFLLTRLSDGVTTAASFAASGYPHAMSVDGLNITLSAGASLHDNWVIEPTRMGANNMTVLVKDATGIAAAAPIRAAAALANSSAATISAGAVTSAASLPLSATISLTFDAVNSRFNVAGAVPAVAPIAYSSGNAVSFNGLSFTISGTPANGDVFTVERNAGGSVDNRNALMLGALQTTNTIGRDASVAGSLASTTYNGAYAELVSQIGNTARQTELMATAQTNVITQAKQAQQSVSGVNLDEEAANLLRYQQAYQASGKMMQIASTLFQTLLDLGR